MSVSFSTDPVQDLIAAGVLATTVVGVLNRRKLKESAEKIDEVHGLVNAQLTAAVDRRDVAEGENVQLRHDADQKRKEPPP
jgi:uncharacterized pyridoxal phosphate-containing UPF0001 family protein